MSDTRIVFFGTSRFSVIVLDALNARGIVPIAVVTTPDKPQGRKLIMTPPPAKVWAQEHHIPVYQFEKLKPQETIYALRSLQADLYIVASYGKIIPQAVLDIPAHGALNVHPSLLPKYRGASPLQSSILHDEQHTGVTIIQMDALMDHGPIVAQKEMDITPWPVKESVLEEQLAKVGADILADALPGYLDGSHKPQTQDESLATFTAKITKEDGHIDVPLTKPDMTSAEQYATFLKIQAFEGWPGTYFFVQRKDKQIRVSVKDAVFHGTKDDGSLEITRVVPEGGKEMNFSDFVRGIK